MASKQHGAITTEAQTTDEHCKSSNRQEIPAKMEETLGKRSASSEQEQSKTVREIAKQARYVVFECMNHLRHCFLPSVCGGFPRVTL